MSWKSVLGFMFFLLVFGLLLVYWFFPLSEKSFLIENSGNSNFTLNASLDTSMQFYENMRYPDSEISYKIENCPLQKKDEMMRAFDLIRNLTMLDFYEANNLGEEEISITCEDTIIRGEQGAFIAGEGGVTKLVATENFNVILNGKVLLLRETQCQDPLVPTHELLHALGFDHSENPNNVMYPTIKCGQTIGQDLLSHIDYLYSFPSLPDLSFENVSATTHARYLDVAVTVRNHGLQDSENSTIIISSNGKSLKEFDVGPVSIGSGRIITLKNIVTLTRPEELEFYLLYNLPELDKNNNRIILKTNN